jgi:hypothetical protein
VIAAKETKQGKEIKYEKQKERKSAQVKQGEAQRSGAKERRTRW